MEKLAVVNIPLDTGMRGFEALGKVPWSGPFLASALTSWALFAVWPCFCLRVEKTVGSVYNSKIPPGSGVPPPRHTQRGLRTAPDSPIEANQRSGVPLETEAACTVSPELTWPFRVKAVHQQTCDFYVLWR